MDVVIFDKNRLIVQPVQNVEIQFDEAGIIRLVGKDFEIALSFCERGEYVVFEKIREVLI